MDRLLTIGQASKLLGVSVSTLRRWERTVKILPIRLDSGHRRYVASDLKPGLMPEGEARATIAYARVSSHDQKKEFIPSSRGLGNVLCCSSLEL